MFAGVTTKGIIQIFTEVLLDSNGTPTRTDMDPHRIDIVKYLKASGSITS